MLFTQDIGIDLGTESVRMADGNVSATVNTVE